MVKCEECKCLKDGRCTLYNGSQVIKKQWGGCWLGAKIDGGADVVEVVRCEKCKYFREYSDAHKRAVERADGDCFLKLIHSCDEQFIACRYNDFCSYGEKRLRRKTIKERF